MTNPASLDSDLAHVLHPLHHPANTAQARIWVEGRGSVMTDADGRSVIDGLAGLWNVNVGHGRTELAEAARDQMSSLAYCSSYAGSTNYPAMRLAEELSRLTYPSINTFFFTSGGAEATETSIKTARFYWKAVGKPEKTKVISRMRAYHGLTLAAMSATGLPAFWPMFEPRVPGFSHIAAPDPYRYVSKTPGISVGVAAANELEEAILREGPDTVAGFIAEPIQGAGGVIIPPDDYFPRVRQICDQYGVLLIADDVITGFGRTGTWFGLEHWGVEPDIMQFAKGITSGYLPLGGIGVSDAIRDVINHVPPAKRWMHAFTYSGHPTCCAVALRNIRILREEDLVARAAEMGTRLAARLAALSGLDGVGHVRSLGLIGAVEVVADKATKALHPPELQMTQRLTDSLLARGLYTRVVLDCICIAPPLVITETELDRLVDIIGETVSAVIHSARTGLGYSRRMRKCPVCGVPMTETPVGPVQVDECPQCRGMWFQDDELRLAKDATDRDLRWLDVDLWKHAERFRVDPHHLKCPDCGLPLVVVRYGDTPFDVHCCPPSRGIWLDRGEFAAILEALEAGVVTFTEADYIKASLRQAKEVVTGRESFLSEWRDLQSVLRLLHHRFFVEHQGLANFLRNVPRLP